MHVILTHEQADFDAVASQLGAWLLDNAAIPVLPGRINRNVRAFLTLYGIELPFVERRDLPRGRIEVVSLVDTQSSITLKGMDAKTRIGVVDHHPRRADLPSDWQVTVQPTGATATLLVEVLRERQITLKMVEATLMLLGIYEDTGSLTYTRTTPRDLQAAAFLLEQGASLQIAQQHLNLPLSLAQQELLDQLREAAQFHEIHNHTVVIATGDARQMQEELSSVAHKLRDLLDPDGLILLVAVPGGVQLVARTNDDHIDAAAIARHFGGGGHQRAAAAIINSGELEPLAQELREILPEHVRPPVTVAEIMSRGPQLLSPDAPIAEAARRMQRYGYEGYPVVENDQVIGLLTRRAVDRALSHRLNVKVRDVMRAGSTSVAPGDSVQHLQRVMTEADWGQVPVLDPQDGRVTGIVTRTDLLKILSPEVARAGRQNLAERLEQALPAGHLALLQEVARLAHRRHSPLYIVGGFVRDLLLEQPSLDFDLVIEGDAIQLARELCDQFGGRVTFHKRFGTAKWQLDTKMLDKKLELSGTRSESMPGEIDLITARSEFYAHPTALPTVEQGSIKLDLHRRDFTINTLALRLDGRHYGELQDYWGGFDDLRRGLIRVLHSLSFIDDPTRMLRAVRFEQRFGFQIEDRTLELMQTALVPQQDGVSLLDRVSGDRIRHELDYSLGEPRAMQILARLHELGLLEAIHPDLPWDAETERRMAQNRSPSGSWNLSADIKGMPLDRSLAYTLWLYPLPVRQSAAICRRLQMRQVLVQMIQAAGKLWRFLCGLDDATPSKLVARLDETPLPAVYAIFLGCTDASIRDSLHAYVTEWRHLRPQTSGHDLRERGLPPGPAYKQILARLRAAWLDGHIASVAEEQALLETLLDEQAAVEGD